MDTITAPEIYRIRPDIFVKGGEDRVYINYRQDHYVLRLQRKMVDAVFRFLHLVDGMTPLAEILATFPAEQRGNLDSLLRFLVGKSAAFRVAPDAAGAQLEAVKDTLLYLAEYHDDPDALFRRFARRRTLIVGSGYALASCIKTLARLGIMKLDVLLTATDERNRWSAADLERCFAEMRRWPDATLTFIDALPASAPHDDILHLDLASDPAAHVAAELHPGAGRHLYAIATDRHVCVTHAAQPRAAAAPAGMAPPAQLVAGAFVALAYFDDLCGIRILEEGDYHYYPLDAHGRVNSTRYVRLAPAAALAPAAGPGADRASLKALLRGPLFPLCDLVERSDPGSYVKLFSVAFRQLPGVPAGATLAAAGFTRDECEQRILLQLIDDHGLWFDGGNAAEADEVGLYLQARTEAIDACAPLQAEGALGAPGEGQAELEHDETAQEAYLAFCINAGFGERLQWHAATTGNAAYPHCLVLCCAGVRLYLPHDGTASGADRIEMLFALHRALWQRREGIAPGSDVLLPLQCRPLGGRP